MSFPHPMDDHTGFANPNAVDCDRCGCEFVKNQYSLVTDPWGGNAEFVCDGCQESAYDRHQERLMEDGGEPSMIEQQQAAYKIKHGLR